MSTMNQQKELMCRFCMLQNEELDIFRIPWYEWQDSPLAAMYESVMKQELPYLKECLEVCYCNKCAELLCQTVHALQMFQRSDTYWRTIFVGAPSSANIAATEIMAEYLDDDDLDAISGWDTKDRDSLKIELIGDDYEELSEAADSKAFNLDENGKELYKYEDFFKMIREDEQIGVDPANCYNNDSRNDESTTNEIQNVKSKIKRPLSKIIKKVKSTTERKDNLPCVLCNEIFSNRTLLNRHTDARHSMIQCIQCPFTATTRKLMQRHELVEHKRTIDSISPCPKCRKIFTDPYRLTRHNRTAHAPLVSSQCHLCSRIFKNSFRLKTHLKNVHGEAIFECDICTRKFRQKKNLKIHIMAVHAKEAKFICTACGRPFTTHLNLKLHEAKPCRIFEIYRAENRVYNPNPIFSCSLCSIKFSDLGYGKTHYQKIHKITDVSGVCMICNHLSSSPDDLSEHLNTNHSALSCSVCKRFFKSQISLKSHIATHSKKERPFECKICKATFVRSVNLQDHYKRTHSAERPHKCTDCDLRFVTNWEMSAHWHHKHDPNRKFKCNWCEKRFVTNTALSLHEPVHTGVGKYNCDICRQNFRLVHQLIKHFQVDHPDHDIR